MLVSSARAQTGNWRDVENLRNGSIITVRTPHRVKCAFEGATHDALICERIQKGLFRIAPSELGFDRRSIREVRLERGDDANAAAGTAIGAGVGMAVGASVGRKPRVAGALVLGAVGGAIGWIIGQEHPILPGRIVYQR